MPATAPLLDAPETTPRFGDGGGPPPAPPKGPCRLYVFPHARRAGWIDATLAAAARKKSRAAVVNFLKTAISDRMYEMKRWELKKAQMEREIWPVCDVFNEWLASEWPKSPQ